MRLVIASLFIVLTLSATSPLSDAKDFMLGFMIGLRATVYVPEGYDCAMAVVGLE